MNIKEKASDIIKIFNEVEATLDKEGIQIYSTMGNIIFLDIREENKEKRAHITFKKNSNSFEVNDLGSQQFFANNSNRLKFDFSNIEEVARLFERYILIRDTVMYI